MPAREQIRPIVTVEDFERFLFIVGAPRCGTTTLSRFLKSHPSVHFPAIKEPHFFAEQELKGLSCTKLKRRVEQDYLQRFFRPNNARSVGADASVTYFYHPEQLEPILRLWPDSRFVVSVRDPLTMLPSLHQRLIFVGQESIPTFAEAWVATSDRRAGRRIPRTCHDPRLLRYDEAARFGTYLERLFATVGRERCEVLVFDDLVDNPARQYRRLMEFAGLEPQASVDFSPHREGQGVRLRWLQRALKQPPVAIRSRLGTGYFRHKVERSDRPDSSGALEAMLAARKLLLRWNRTSGPAEPLPVKLQAEIARHFEDEVVRLGDLIGRDLSHWLQPSLERSMTRAVAPPLGGSYRRAYSH